ncbi:hypothetical protein Glove_117g195 [Diversispora epigaea]|uniref:Protein kinase domain-containing protein n=1 Tax=Diversispora epigaea TaxID=1348612 RepID=A0A397JA99_9GLOM|nr:hypothetical protein Glove_117g195 [Diversispora epigaea]
MSQSKTNNNFTTKNNSKAGRTEFDEDIPFYNYSKFENVELINKNFKSVYKANIKKVSQQEKTITEVVTLKCISLNNEFTLNNFINEVKRYRKLEINDNFLKFYGITKHENSENYMIVLENANNGSLRQYLRTNFQKFNWNIKLNLAKQISNALMDLHENDIIHGKLTSDSILVHNGAIKLNYFCMSYLKSLATFGATPFQYTDFRYLELFNKSLDIYSLGIILWEISNDENSENYMIVLENANNGSLRQYLRTNFQKFNWNIKLNLAKQISNALMDLHENDIIHGKLTSDSILVHNGAIKLNYFCMSYLKSLATFGATPFQYTDFRYLELFNKSLDIYSLGIILWEISNDGISPFEKELMTKPSLLSSTSTNNNIIDLINNTIVKLDGEKSISGIPPKYKEIYTDCLKRQGNYRPDIFEIVNNLSEINIISDINAKNKLEKSFEEEIPSSNSITKSNDYDVILIKKLFEYFINVFKIQSKEMRPVMIKNYVREYNLNPVKILHKLIRYPSHYWFTSLIGFFYQYGIGTVKNHQMAFSFFNLASNERIDMKNISSNLSLRKFYNINKEIGIIYLAHMYIYGIGVEKDLKKGFQIYSKVADEGSNIALTCMAYSYYEGHGVEKNEKRHLRMAKDEIKGSQLHLKSVFAGNLNAINNVGYCYDNGIGVDVDKKEAFKWYFKSVEKGNPMSQINLGYCYTNGYGVKRDLVKAFEWYKKSAENEYVGGQYIVGKYFYEGLGTRKDIIKAIYWLNKARENGNINANRLLLEIINRIIFF